jgi:superfamily II DNA helicase RecQ
MYSARAQFCGLQKPVLEAIIRNKSPVLVVIGTSVRKTLLFQILAINVGFSTTVVIMLLVLLQDHII